MFLKFHANELYRYTNDLPLVWQAGYNNGDLTNHYSIPGSLTSCVQNLATSTNVGHTGRYIFQVGSANYNIGFVKPPSGLTSLSKQKRKKRGAENEVEKEETV